MPGSSVQAGAAPGAELPSWGDDFLRPLRDGRRPSCSSEQDFFSPGLEVRDAPGGAGRGLFLTSSAAVVPGQLLLLEAACFEGEAQELFLEAACSEAWQELEERPGGFQRRRWSLLGAAASGDPPAAVGHGRSTPVAEWGSSAEQSQSVARGGVTAAPSSAWLAGAVRLNGMANVDLVDNPSGLRHIGHEEGSGGHGGILSLYPVGGLLNHSCYPSAEKVAFPGWLVVRAARALRGPQAELTHNYLDVRSPLAVRRQQLKEGWGFTCKCDRCLLEEAVWTDVKLQNEGQLLWQAFHVMIAQRKGGLSAMSQLVQAMERITDQALEQYLVQQISKSGEEGLLGGNPWFAQFRPAFELTPKQTRLLMSGQEVQGHDVAVLAFKRLRNCLLASHWLSPAMQLSHGLRDSRRFDQSLELLGKIIAVLKEVLPHSSLHVATCVQRAACAADAGRPEPEARALFFGVAQVAEAAYGDGGAALEILMEARLAGDDAAAALLNTCLEGLRGGESCVHEAALTGLAESQPAGSSSEVRRTEVDESKSLLQAAEAVPGYATTRRTLKSGVGPAVGVGSRVTLHATGVVAETGRKFWSTKDPGCQPFTYQAGVGEVITGWDQGCLGMVLGEERQLLIPAAEGYGAQGFAAWAIPPYATLDFTLECLSIQGGSSPARPAATQDTNNSNNINNNNNACSTTVSLPPAPTEEQVVDLDGLD